MRDRCGRIALPVIVIADRTRCSQEQGPSFPVQTEPRTLNKTFAFNINLLEVVILLANGEYKFERKMYVFNFCRPILNFKKKYFVQGISRH